MSDCILCGEQLPIESFLGFKGMPSCAQNIPDKDSLYKDRGMDLNLFQCGSTYFGILRCGEYREGGSLCEGGAWLVSADGIGGHACMCCAGTVSE